MTPSEALAVIGEKYQHFGQMGARLEALEAQALAVVEEAAAAYDRETQLAAHELAVSIEALQRQWAGAWKQVEWIRARVPLNLSLGAVPVIPVAVSAVAVALVGWIVYLEHREDRAELAVEAVADGRLTVDEARDLLDPAADVLGLSDQLGDVLRTAVLTGGLALLAKWFLESRARAA